MERLMEDALRIQRLLPWIESDEDIINFMRKIPLDRSHLRNQLTLHYFLKQTDSFGDGFEKGIEDDAREIVISVPDTSYKEIKDRLTILGNISNRKEVVLRQLLYEKRDLDRLVKEIDVSPAKKRKAEPPHDNIFDLDSSSNETNIKIKIRKRDGNLEVVSTIKQEKTSPSKAVSTTPQAIEESPSSSTSVTNSESHSEASSPDSTVPTTSAETINDPCPEFTSILQKVMDKNQQNQPSTSRATMPAKRKIRSPTPPMNTRSRNHLVNTNNTEDDSDFNLLKYLQEITQVSNKRIKQVCKRHKLDLTQRPKEETLSYIVNELFEDIIEVKSDDSNMSSASVDSGDSTQEYELPDKYRRFVVRMLENQEAQAAEDAAENPTLISDARQFRLKAPVLNLTSTTATCNEDVTLPKPIILSASSGLAIKQPVLKRPVFTIPENPTHREENIIPAMPQAFLDRLQIQRSKFPASLTRSPERPMLLSSPEIGYLSPEAGPSNVEYKKKVKIVDEKLVLRLIEMFPEADPQYIREICDGKQWSEFDDIITVILSAENYPKRPQRPPSPAKEVDLEGQFEIFKELLPDADPTYLRMQCEKYINDDKGLKAFINQAMEVRDYPTMKEYLRKQQLSAQLKQYTSNFNIEHFIHLFPEPEKTFNDPNRQIIVDPYSTHYLNLFFRNKFDKISARAVQQVLTQNDYKIIPSNKALERLVVNNQVMKSRRKATPLPDNLQNIPLLQELAFVTHEKEITTYLKEKQIKEEQEREEAKNNGLMESCLCCFDDEVMPRDTYSCPNGCNFCKGCIKRSCEIALGDGKTTFLCMANCSVEFTLHTLQSVLPPKMFSKLAQKKALAEIKAAGIEELEMCPFCVFATIPNEADKIFRCLNPDCMKESCRLCKEPNHVPLKCEEVEKDEAVKARTYIENKMTEALLRKCWKCGTSFFKEEGCNKMTCSCGAQMCYICKQPVKDYSHFNGIGGDKFNLCPLYSDTNLVNKQNVMEAAETAKANIDPSNLKVDPSADVADHYEKRSERLPREPHMDLLNVNNPPQLPHHQHHRHPQQPHHHRQRVDLLREQQQANVLPEVTIFAVEHDAAIIEQNVVAVEQNVPGFVNARTNARTRRQQNAYENHLKRMKFNRSTKKN